MGACYPTVPRPFLKIPCSRTKCFKVFKKITIYRVCLIQLPRVCVGQASESYGIQGRHVLLPEREEKYARFVRPLQVVRLFGSRFFPGRVFCRAWP